MLGSCAPNCAPRSASTCCRRYRTRSPRTRVTTSSASTRVVWVETATQVGIAAGSPGCVAGPYRLPSGAHPTPSPLQGVATAAVESGFRTILATPATAPLVHEWQALATFDTLTLQADGHTITDAQGQQVTKGGCKDTSHVATAMATLSSARPEWPLPPESVLLVRKCIGCAGAHAVVAANARVTGPCPCSWLLWLVL
jgi:hypothetical protein